MEDCKNVTNVGTAESGEDVEEVENGGNVENGEAVVNAENVVDAKIARIVNVENG